jgi:hypothetical protein
MSNLDTYVHVCYIATLLRCAFGDNELNEGMGGGISMLLMLCALAIIVSANLRRVKMIWEFKNP